MAGNIKGITIEFRGETTKLDTALKKIAGETKSVDTELKKVKNALKFNPTSVTLWSQKQQLLTEKVQKTQEKLKLLKQEQKRLKADGVDKNSKEYRELQREIIETESKARSFRTELNKTGEVHFRALSEGLREAGDKLTAAGQALAPVSEAAAALAGSIAAVTIKSASFADDLLTMSKVYGISTDKLQLYAATAKLVDVEVETIAKAHVKLTKNMGSAQKGTKKAVEMFDKLGVKVTDASGNLRDSEDVFDDVLKALAGMDNETERDAAAMDIFGKSAAELNPLIEDAGETYKRVADTFEKYDLQFVDEETIKRAGEFDDQLETMKAIGATALQTIGTQLAGYLVPALEKLVDWVGQLANWLSTLDPETVATVAAIAAVIAVVSPLLLILGQLAFALSALAGAMAIITGPIGLIVVAIAGLIAIGVLLWKNWDTIKAKAASDWEEIKGNIVAVWEGIKAKIDGIKTAIQNTWNSMKNNAINAWNSLKNTATNTFQKIKDAITKPIEDAKQKFKGIIDSIKNFFPISIGKIFSNLQLPHFSLSGAFDLKKGTIPHISVDWYAQGGIFNSPSVIGVGEAGSEAVIPLDKLWRYLDAIAANGGGNTFNIYGANAREIALEVEKIIIADNKRRRLAWQ